mgnify:CR=1 FL=1
MSFDVHTFRERYRAAISPGYNPWLHAGFVALFGLGVAAALLALAAAAAALVESVRITESISSPRGSNSSIRSRGAGWVAMVGLLVVSGPLLASPYKGVSKTKVATRFKRGSI